MARYMFFVGTRPEIIKAAPVIKALARRGEDVEIVHVGQHYDRELGWIFFEEFRLPKPRYELGVGSGSQGRQTGETIIRAERVIGRALPDVTLAVGDTNSVLGVALASVKLGVPFAHVEAGLRSFDMTMPEEINRRLADHVASANFAPSSRAYSNLLEEGLDPERVWLTGNTIVDAVKQMIRRALRESKIDEKLGIAGEMSVLVTVHRRENVDEPARLSQIASALADLDDVTVVWPMHPRTRAALSSYGLLDVVRASRHIKVTKPLGYLDFLKLLNSSTVVATDSGGVQEEAITLGVPCVILRDNTERPELIEAGVGVLAGANRAAILDNIRRMLYMRRRIRIEENPFGDGRAGERIARILTSVNPRDLRPTSPRYEEGAPVYAVAVAHRRVDASSLRRVGVKILGVYRRGTLCYDEQILVGDAVKILGEKSRVREALRLLGGV